MKIKNKKTGALITIPKHLEEGVKKIIAMGGDPITVLQSENTPLAKEGIHINPKNVGKFNATKKRTGKTTEELTHSKNPVTKKRAIFAQNATKWKKAEDGLEIGEDSFNPEAKLLTYNAFKNAGYFDDYAVSTRMSNNESGYDFTKPLFNQELGQFQNPKLQQNNTQFPKSQKFQPNIQGSRSATETFMTGLSNLPAAIQDPSNPAAWAAVGDLPMTGTKAILEQIGARKTNKRLASQVKDELRDAQTLNFLNNYNDSQYGTTNIGMAEHGKLIQYQNGGRAPIKGTKEQYQAYQDSSQLSDYTKELLAAKSEKELKFKINDLQPWVERNKNKIKPQGFKDIKYGSNTYHIPIYQKPVQPYVYNNERNLFERFADNVSNTIEGTSPDFLLEFLENSARKLHDIFDSNSQDVNNQGATISNKKPVQPIIYEPDLKTIAQNFSPSIVTPSTTSTYKTLKKQTQKVNPLDLELINIQSFKPDLLQGTDVNMFNPIPFEKGTYFTRARQSQEQGSGTDYFDKKTGKLMGTYEDGGIAKYKSMNQGGLANVLTENKEVGQLPSGLIDTMYGDNHSDPSGGIHMNLPEGSKIFSEKLKHPEKKKSFAKLAKKFETKKDFENLESPIADNINKFTADLNIKFKNKASDELFAEQENMKLNGVFGDKVKNNTMKDYEMKYGGLTKMDGESGANMTPFESTKDSRKKPSWWGDRTKLEEMMSNFEKTSGYNFPYYTPDYDVNKMAADYQKAVINKHPQIVTNLFKNKALPFTNKAVDLYKKQNKTKTTPNETELIKFYNKNPQLITEQFGDDLWGMRGFEMQDLPFNSPEEYAAWKQDKDWIPVGDNYFYDVSGENETPLVYKPKLNYSTQQKVKRPSEKLQIPASTPIEKGKYNNQGFKAIPVVQPFQEPYLESPVARFTFNPNLIDYRNQNPDFTEIDRQYQGAKTGDPRIDANLFAKTLNAKNQIAFGTQAQNRQGQMQVDQYNAGALDRLQQLQYGEDNTYRKLVNQMRGALNTQKLMDRSVAQSNAQKQMDYYNFALPTIETLYGVDPNEQYIKKGNPLSAYTTEKTKEVKKYGGKIKPKFKKKSSK